MKRWKDRGEVSDSDKDDEELTLTAESESPGRRIKRVKLNSSTDRSEVTTSSLAGGCIREAHQHHGCEEDHVTRDTDISEIVGQLPITLRRNVRVLSHVAIGRPTTAVEQYAPVDDNFSSSSPGSPLERSTESPGRQRNVGYEWNTNLSTESSPLSSLPSTDEFLQLNYPGATLDLHPTILRGSQRDTRRAGDGTLSQEHSVAPSGPLEHANDEHRPKPTAFRFPRLGEQQGSQDSNAANDAGHRMEERSAPPTVGGTVRRLRRRNQKQLHPYMFDKIQYQQQCRERGLRPVKIIDQERHRPDTQDFSADDSDGESQAGSNESASSPIASIYGVEDETAERRRALTSNFLALSDDSSSSSESELPQTRERNQDIENARDRSKPSQPWLPHRSGHGIFAGPPKEARRSVPTPPTSSSPNDSGKLKRVARIFQMPLGLERDVGPGPPSLQDLTNPSQALSGTLHKQLDKRTRLNIPDQPDTQTLSHLDEDRSAESSDRPSSPESDVVESRLQQERRRIRGVLPASWLRIDLQAQENGKSSASSRRRREALSPAKASPQKGVARVVASAKAQTGSASRAILLSDDESGSDGGSYGSQVPVSATMPDPTELYIHDVLGASREDSVDDVVEVDTVDQMLAETSHTRRNRPSKSKRDRLSTVAALNASKSRAAQINALRSTVPSRKRRKAAKDGPRLTTMNQSHASTSRRQLSIVDATEQALHSIGPLPQFVRLAIRRARGQENYGRHSPTNKYLRLATREDTADATTALQQWRGGSILPTGSSLHSADRTIDAARVHRYEASEANVRLPAQSNEDDSKVQHHRGTQVTISEGRKAPATKPSRRRKQQHSNSHHTKAMLSTVQQPREFRTARTAGVSEGAKKRNDKVSTQATRSRQIQSNPVKFRDGQYETLETDFMNQHRTAAFARRISCLTENVAKRAHTPDLYRLPLERYLNLGRAGAPTTKQRSRGDNSKTAILNVTTEDGQAAYPPHKRRKRVAHRLEAAQHDSSQTRGPLQTPISISISSAQDAPAAAEQKILKGLGPPGTGYTTTFGITPLDVGTYFHESSFVGSGEFAASLASTQRDLDSLTGRIRINVDHDVLEWGQWTEIVAAQFPRISQAVLEALSSCPATSDPSSMDIHSRVVEANVDYLLRSTIRYFAKCLSFIDPIDRLSCSRTTQRLVEDLLDFLADDDFKTDRALLTRCLQYTLLLAHQAYKLSFAVLESPAAENDESKTLIARCARTLVRSQKERLLQELRAFYDDNKIASTRETGIRDNNVTVSSCVVMYHVIHDVDGSTTRFWDILAKTLELEESTTDTVSDMDAKWHGIFTVLPILEIDPNGMTIPGSRLKGRNGHGPLIKGLLLRLFDFYPATSLQSGSSINEYVRATLHRCERLITRWGWWRCEAFLGAIYDFFAHRRLMVLHLEHLPGSPKFLETLDQQPSLDVQPTDCSYHIFLKMLASGFRGMHKYQLLPDKKIGSTAWRFVPNHGRTYLKDAEIRQKDIDSLRNHHDLLCTLYFALPPDHRMRLSLLGNIVDHAASHREACRVSVRAWSYLAAFQASVNEPTDRLGPFCEWFTEIFKTTVSQYCLARSEAEKEITSVTRRTTATVSAELMEDTIARNQRQIIATLIDALAALRRAILACRTLDAAMHLMRGTAGTLMFDLFDVSTRRVNNMLDETVQVGQAVLDVYAKFSVSGDNLHSADDSQEFGDASVLQDYVATQMACTEGQSLVDTIHKPFELLLSNVFGDDAPVDGALLIRIVDFWTRLASAMVQQRKKDWSSYVNSYEPFAWQQLRDTVQKRTFTPYFLSCIVDRAAGSIDHLDILGYWARSLVERESVLQYQHLLTAALLNSYPDLRILENVPFSRSRRNGRYEITLQELSQRRLGLISSVLSNMRREYDEALREGPESVRYLRQAYGTVLQQMMHIMKQNYVQTLSAKPSRPHDPPGQGTYVDFVQRVVSFLQQFTAPIRAVDEFFTDSSAFPLPVEDPTYVVGKLKSYVVKLGDAGTRKQLQSFFQSLCERTATDQQQQYLIDQLTAALTGLHETGGLDTPSLRQVVCTTIFPEYVENALRTSVSWVLAIPILKAWGQISELLLYDLIMNNDRTIEAATSSLDCLFASVQVLIKSVLQDPKLLALPRVLRTVAESYLAVYSGLTTIQALRRATVAGKRLMARVDHLASYAASIEVVIKGHSTYVPPAGVEKPVEPPEIPWLDTRQYMRRELQQSLDHEWQDQNGTYYLRKYRMTKEILFELDDSNGEKRNLVKALGNFQKAYRTIFGSTHNSRDRPSIRRRDGKDLDFGTVFL